MVGASRLSVTISTSSPMEISRSAPDKKASLTSCPRGEKDDPVVRHCSAGDSEYYSSEAP